MNSDQIQIIELLAQNEEVLVDLYKLYSQQYPEYKDFWESISNDEVQHAQWLRDLIGQINSGVLSFNPNRFNQQTVFESLHHGRQSLERARQAAMSAKEALALSLKIEKSLIESKFFEVAQTDSLALKETLARLALSTELHVVKIEEALLKLND